MPFVLDASVVAVWYFPDEKASLADKMAHRLRADSAWVPALFWFEIRNLLLVGERRLRIKVADTPHFLSHLESLPIEIDRQPASEDVLAIARAHRLTIYDAAYLELAQRRGHPLATLDGALGRAAQGAGIGLLSA
jgi:predicted nucleic acid-binding protein